MKVRNSLGIPVLAALLIFFISVQAQNNPSWKNLFNGKNLKGWEQKGGKAKYHADDGMIIGTASMKAGGNSFLCTKKYFSDFILEYEFKVDDGLNSGVQIRSNSYEDYQDGRVHGYQVEIDPSDRAWTAGIYDEGRRGWLNNLKLNDPARKAFKHNDWNSVRVEATGNRIKTWINGVPAANLIDDMTASGFIGLQVHGIWDESKEGLQVRWKNIRICTKNPEKFTTETTAREYCTIPNCLSKNEIAEGWVLLFDGKTTNRWRGAHKDSFPEKGWHIENGTLVVEAADGAESGNGGDIITTDEYDYFILELEFKLTDGANSGIKYFITENYNADKSAIGLEYQILDDKRHPDAKKGVKGNRTLASLYDLIPASSDKKYYHGYWNRAKLVVQGNHIEHWLNDQKVLEYERNNQMFNALVAYSKYKNHEGFGNWEKGHILLQDHGDEVSFRNIKIRILQ